MWMNNILQMYELLWWFTLLWIFNWQHYSNLTNMYIHLNLDLMLRSTSSLDWWDAEYQGECLGLRHLSILCSSAWTHQLLAWYVVGPPHGLTNLLSYFMEKQTLSAGCTELLQHTVHFLGERSTYVCFDTHNNDELDIYLATIRLNIQIESCILDVYV